MINRKFLFYGVLTLLLITPLFLLTANKISNKGILVVFPIILLCTGIWVLLRKRIIGDGKAEDSTKGQTLTSTSSPFNTSQTGLVTGTQFKGPKVRRDKGSFIIEDNLDAIQWPEECSSCGGVAEHHETLKLKEKFKDQGQVQVEVGGIPYCKKCIRRARWTNRLNNLVITVALIIGIALTLFTKLQEFAGRSSGTSVPWWLTFLVCIAIGYGISWLIFKMPFKLLLRKRLVEPITAWLMEDLKSDGQQGISVAISIPQKSYAEKFAQMNVTAASSSIPMSEVDDQTLVRVIQPDIEEPARGIRSKVTGKIDGIDYLIECTRDDIMDTDELWTMAVNDLQRHGEDGSNALAGLIEEMLRCRANSISTAIAMSHNLFPTKDLLEVLTAVQSARPLTSTFFGARFRPQIEGGGMIGWTDGTAARIRSAASEALNLLTKPLPLRPDVDKMEKEGDVQGLIEALSYRVDMLLREASARALGKIGDKQAIGALETALKDGSLPVRTAANEALALINKT